MLVTHVDVNRLLEWDNPYALFIYGWGVITVLSPIFKDRYQKACNQENPSDLMTKPGSKDEEEFEDECDADHTNPRGGCGCC